MKILMPLIVLCSVFLLQACSFGTGGGLFGNQTASNNTVDVTQLPSMRVVGIIVEVPDTLSVSEENIYKPVADIVWRGDPFGDRYAQVKAIVEEAAKQGASSLQGDFPVVVHIQIQEFHALTEITRYSIGGVHAIEFLMSVTDGRTGEEVVPAYVVAANLKGLGGEDALAAEREGQTQKVRIVDHLAAVIQSELTGQPIPPAS